MPPTLTIPPDGLSHSSPTKPVTNRRLSNFHTLATSPSHSIWTPSKGTPAMRTPATKNRRLSNFHRSDRSPLPQRTPLRPLNLQTPITATRRQSFAPKHFHATPRSPPQSARHDARSRQPQLSKAEIAQMYSSTIKLCQDNKINARNTWTLNLIDYMSMLVRDEHDPPSTVARTVSFQDDIQTESQTSNTTADTNFQLAGVTLDAGVKIYCSRVDSVHTNAFKVLGGLSRTGTEHTSNSDEEHDPNDESAEDRSKKQNRSKRTGRCTLEANLSNITSQKLETDLAVDPLFHKMSAAFDEGGAKGMLMNNLPVGPRGQVLFDSSDPADDLLSSPHSRTDEPGTPSTDSQVYNISGLLPPEPVGDSDGLCSAFMRFYAARERALNLSEALDTNSEAGGSRSEANNTLSAPSFENDALNEHPELDFDYDAGDLQNAGELGVFAASEFGQEMPGAEDDDEVHLFPANGDGSQRFSTASNLSMAVAAQRGGLDLVEAGIALHDDPSYAFFDTNSLSGWAGPQHWRFRAVTASRSALGNGGSKDAGKTSKRPRGKTAMLLDFYSDAPAINFAEEFEPGKTETTHQLSTSVRDSFSEKKVTQPEDLHYMIRNLASLFLKPGTTVRANRGLNGTGAQELKASDGEEWYDFENDCDNENFCPEDNEDSFDMDGSVSKNDDSEIGMQLIDEPTRVEKIDINYAKVAKKVDVRQLKSGLWSKLCGESVPQDQSEDQVDSNLRGADRGNPADGETADIREGFSQRLQTVVSDMTSFVPASSLPDVSIPYVFICLLHLANEKTLKITQEGNESLTDLIISSGEDSIN